MTEEERALRGELQLRARGVLTHAQARRGVVVVPPWIKNPLEAKREYRRSKQRLNPLRAVKHRMMREGGLSSRQWRHFRKRMRAEAKREVEVGGLRD